MPAKRGIGADRRLSLSGMPVLKPELVRLRSYAHVLELLARCAGLATAFTLSGQPVAGTGVFDHLPTPGIRFVVLRCPSQAPI